jgi:hypothetical protein
VPVWVGPPAGGTIEGVDDFLGAAVPLKRLGAGVLLPLTGEPLYVRCRGDGGMPQVKVMVDAPAEVLALPDQPVTFDVRISNPLAEPLAFETQATAALPGFAASAAPAGVRLGPGETGVARVSLAPDAPAAAPSLEDGAVVVRVKAGGGDAPAIESRVPCRRVLPIGRRGDGLGALALSLVSPRHLHNLFTAVPRPEMRWAGRADLSVDARLSYDAEALYLDAWATDDRHAQPRQGARLWEGDSLQVAVQGPPGAPRVLELAIGLTDAGREDGWVFSAIPGGAVAAGALDRAQAPYKVERAGGRTIYALRLPWEAMKLEGPPREPLRLSFLVNDDDGAGRKQWVELSPGIGGEKDPALFRPFVCR